MKACGMVADGELVGHRHIGRNEVNARHSWRPRRKRAFARQTIQLGDYPPADVLSTLDGVEASKFAAARMGTPLLKPDWAKGGCTPPPGRRLFHRR
jgi:hypothetical protein